VATATTPNRQDLVRRGQRLEYFTIAYNSVEGLVSIVAGLIAGSVSLIGFGLDSAIEVASGAALLWRLHHDLNRSRREQVERITLRIVGWCFVALALYIAYESGSTDPARTTGTEHPRNHRRRRLGGGDAVVGTSEAAGCCRNRKRGHERRFQTGRFLHLPVGDPVGRLASQCGLGLVVGRSGGGAGDGSDHRQGRHRRNQGQGVLRRLRVQLKRPPRRTQPASAPMWMLGMKRRAAPAWQSDPKAGVHQCAQFLR
jgi:hypothetical protein